MDHVWLSRFSQHLREGNKDQGKYGCRLRAMYGLIQNSQIVSKGGFEYVCVYQIFAEASMTSQFDHEQHELELDWNTDAIVERRNTFYAA